MPGRCRSGVEPGRTRTDDPPLTRRLVLGYYDLHQHRWFHRGHVRGVMQLLCTGVAVSGGADYARVLFQAEHRERGSFERP